MNYAAGKIEPGVHPTAKVLGLTVNTDVVLSTVVAAVVFLTIAYLVSRRATPGVPGKVQATFEWVIGTVTDLADSAVGKEGRRFVPLGVTIFFFILTCNWLDFLPTILRPGHSESFLPAPTGDVNLPLAMATVVIIWVHVESVRARRASGYVKHYFRPYAALAPINAIEEVTKPITLTFRLFGNLFSGGLMISVMLALLPVYIWPVGQFGWQLFDTGLLGLIQAFIFMLLTILYFGMAMSHDEPDHVALEASH